jgi:hypothetical protein
MKTPISAENLGIIPMDKRKNGAQIIYGTSRSFRSGFKLITGRKAMLKKKLLLNIKNKC